MSNIIITAPGFYRRRDGQKQEIEFVGSESKYGQYCCFGSLDGSLSAWNKHGTRARGLIAYDIIAPWTEPVKRLMRPGELPPCILLLLSSGPIVVRYTTEWDSDPIKSYAAHHHRWLNPLLTPERTVDDYRATPFEEWNSFEVTDER